jgi:hypothetical protein
VLLDGRTELDAAIAGTYCIYQPLATANIFDLVRQQKFSVANRVALLHQDLNGLAFLRVRHQDTKPTNLSVANLNSPVGLNFDLDSATREETSTNHINAPWVIVHPKSSP